MLFKKLAAAAAGSALLLATAVPAFAWVEIHNGAGVINEIMTVANTGRNVIAGGVVRGGLIDTGDAVAGTQVTNVVNSNNVTDWSWDCDCDGVVIANGALVGNRVLTMANTGKNSITGGVVLGGEIDSGNAGAASVVTNVVNTNIVDDFGWLP